MKRVLLIGKDPLFAWALEKKIATSGCHLEHVYTIAEAQVRLNRVHYEAVLLDGLSRHELENLRESLKRIPSIFLLKDTLQETSENFPQLIPVSKETALSEILSSFKELSLI